MRIPAFIINFNRVTLTRRMAEFLSKKENIDVYIIDNNSTYQPLLDWYEECPYKVIRMDENYGHIVFWQKELYNEYVKEGYYIVTDSDLDLSKIPDDWLEVLMEGLNKYTHSKIGFSLEIEDLPESHFREGIKWWENQFWPPTVKQLDDLYFEACIDTTFALYRVNEHNMYSSIRVNRPYIAKHVPWYYTDFSNLPEEEQYYIKHIKTSTLWSRQLNTLEFNS